MRLALVIAAACAAAPPQTTPPIAAPPIRAADNADLRALLAELAEAKACTMFQHVFRGLRDPVRTNVVTGVLWIRDCKIARRGTHLALTLIGSGWQWADQTQAKGGGKFTVRQYVKFDVIATIPGALDVAYDDRTHVASLWYSPTATPNIRFTPVGVDVVEKGAWSHVVGALSSVFSDSPDTQGHHQATKEGTHQFETELGKGLAFTIQLCSGLSRFTLGRPPKGELGPPDVTESRKVPVELEPGGSMVFGPLPAPSGVSVHVESDGPVRVALACAKDAESFAAGFLAGTNLGPDGTLVTGKADLRSKKTCMTYVTARSVAPAKVTFDIERPPAEAARAIGPLIRCARR